MPDGFSMEIQGLNTVNVTLASLSDAVAEGVADELEAAAFEMRAVADGLITSNGAIDQGYLKSMLEVVRIPTGAEFNNLAFYAPFVEFGTKGRVSVPAEWNEYAAQFKGQKNGNKQDFVNNIKDWIGRKGIVVPQGWTIDSLAERIVASILLNGLKARPFMYPAYKQVAEKLPARIENVINDATR